LELQTGGKRTPDINRLRAGLQTGKPHWGRNLYPFGQRLGAAAKPMLDHLRAHVRMRIHGPQQRVPALINSDTLAILSPASLNHLFGLRKNGRREGNAERS
jgi:hypothetical protein